MFHRMQGNIYNNIMIDDIVNMMIIEEPIIQFPYASKMEAVIAMARRDAQSFIFFKVRVLWSQPREMKARKKRGVKEGEEKMKRNDIQSRTRGGKRDSCELLTCGRPTAGY